MADGCKERGGCGLEVGDGLGVVFEGGVGEEFEGSALDEGGGEALAEEFCGDGEVGVHVADDHGFAVGGEDLREDAAFGAR